MKSQALKAFPAFRLRPPADDFASAEVVDVHDLVVGQVIVAGGMYRGRAGTDAGPRRNDALRAAEDVAVFHIALHGPADAEHQPYSGVAQARAAVALVPLQRQEIVDSAARAYFFHALRQPHVAAILDGLDAIVREHFAIGTRAGCLRVARLLEQVREPARALLGQVTGDERDWMAYPLARLLAFTELAIARLDATTTKPSADLDGPFPDPHSADQALATAFRTYRDVQAGAHALPSLPAGTLHALGALDAAAAQLPNGPVAKNRADCRTAASALDELAAVARSVEASTPRTAVEVRALAQELAAIATDTSTRLESTALLLEDASRHGGVRTILTTLQNAELGPETDAGTRSVRVGDMETGPIRRTDNGRWTGPGITDLYHSPEGAAAALLDNLRDQQAAAGHRV
ncbi:MULTISPECIES: hypothetical protein [unclassified Streptomyces]|uniref:hypothetical protein n=1 Tax=unclassified Streptomyces TaxID=2593676 RepID=UPI00224F198E|nr:MULTISPECIES: hypothetical protein [unclassified Streptomyces]MCX4405882.1 hypothetical protein [Streptomyces sp. NBC_01764]MCX5189595.1 hypothetical protein [Streptomyces sp. NBC_00268]